MRFILLLPFILLSATIIAQSECDDPALTKAIELEGIYVFFGELPMQKYKYLGNIKANSLSASPRKGFLNTIDKAKKKFPEVNAIIFKLEDIHSADVVKFEQLVSHVGGYELGHIVQFEKYGKLRTGTVVKLIPHKGSIRVRVVDEKGNEDFFTVNSTDAKME